MTDERNIDSLIDALLEAETAEQIVACRNELLTAWMGWQARGAQLEPVAYRFKNNRGNGKFDYAYYDADQVATAYRDNCLEITPLFTSPPDPRR
ncbi:MAG: hypothetical protein ING73_11265 [Rhodocyclaceae bacterium]|nr:hypothetical protein [Rhodocyclaceae bacterium]